MRSSKASKKGLVAQREKDGWRDGRHEPAPVLGKDVEKKAPRVKSGSGRRRRLPEA